jgi:hypothetical protein
VSRIQALRASSAMAAAGRKTGSFRNGFNACIIKSAGNIFLQVFYIYIEANCSSFMGIFTAGYSFLNTQFLRHALFYFKLIKIRHLSLK